MISKPKVSVITITYNQEGYIRQALDSFINQKTDFSFEVIVSDDKSTDRTPAIIEEYSARYPDIIKPILRKRNLGSMPNFVDALRSSRGEYIAICEGDDYWTDSTKLQSQVDFLEKNPKHALCFHKVEVRFEDNNHKPYIFPEVSDSLRFDFEGLLHANFIQTNSVLYRRQNYDRIPEDIVPGDWYMHLYHAQFGKIGFLDRVMAVYRRHRGGIWWNASQDLDEIWKKYGVQHLALYVEISNLCKDQPAYTAIVNQHIFEMIHTIVRTDKSYAQNKIREAMQRFPIQLEEFIHNEFTEHENSLATVKQHMDKQAAIIQHYVDLSEALKEENAHLQAKLLVRLDRGVRRQAKKVINKVSGKNA